MNNGYEMVVSDETRDVVAWGEKLSAMTAHDIRMLMWDEGIKAVPFKADECAITLLIEKKTGQRIKVGHFGIHPVSSTHFRRKVIYKWKGSGQISAFLINFDTGKYPELVVENSPTGRLSASLSDIPIQVASLP